MVRWLALAVAALLFAPSLAFGQAQIGAGHVWGNSTAAQRPGRDEALTAILDRALGSTRGAIIERSGTGWAIVGPSATVGLPLVSNGTGADPAYQQIPVASAISGLGTGIATALGINVGTAGSPVINGGALGSPSSAGTIPAFTLGGTLSGGGNQLNNVIIGTSTPLGGAFTTLSASSTVSGAGFSTYLASPPAIGGTVAAAGSFTTLIGTTSVSTPIYTSTGAHQFQSNGSTFAGNITTGQQWYLGTTLNAPASGIELTVSKNAAASAAAAAPLAGTLADFIQIDGTASRVAIREFGAGTPGPAVVYYAAGGTAASPTGTLTGNSIGVNFGFGYATTGAAGYVTAAGSGFSMVATENCTTTACGSDFEFITTATGTASQGIAGRFQASGGFSVGTSTDPGAGSIIANKYMQTGSTVVGSLPSCAAGTKGARYFVTDATQTFTSANFGTTVTGAGANNVPVTCDGTNWKIG